MAVLEVRLLGALSAELDGVAVTLPASRRSRVLLAWLALHPGPHGRARLAALLWPDVLDASARASLRSALWALRAALGPGAAEFLVTGRDSAELRGAGLRVDVREFERLMAEGRAAEAVRLDRGELLADLDADWVLDAREEHRDRMAAALALLASRASEAGDITAALNWARRQSRLRPLDEQAGRQLIQLLAASGDTAGALAAYARLAERLRAELGIGPAAEMSRLAAGLRDGDKTRDGATARDRGAARVGQAAPLDRGAAQDDASARLAGRDAEVRRLRRQWQAARDGTGAVAVISGDGGMGKTMLARDMLSAAEADAARSASGAAGGLGGGAPFAVWSELLADLLVQTGPLPGQGQGPGRGWQEELAAMRAGTLASATKPDLDRVRFFEATVAMLSWAARDRPLALVLEDLHLADFSSLELVAYVGRRVARLPVLIVLTRRRLPPRPELDAMLGALRARGALATEIDLRPLPSVAVASIVASHGDVPARQRDQIVALAGGNPLLATEAARSLAANPAGDLADDLSGAARQAIGRLGGPARLFMELASVAGRDLDRAEVASLPLLANPVRAAVEALGTGLLEVRGDRTGFRHELLREAVYRDLPDPVRARLHGALGDWLRERATRPPATQAHDDRAPARGRAGASRGAAWHATEVAGHFRLAGRADLAAASLVRAAAAARSVAALAEAAGYLADAASLSARGHGGPDPEIFIELAEVQAWRGRLAESDDAFGRALELIAPDDNDAQVSAWVRRGRWLRGGICHPRESLRSYRAALDFLDRDPDADPLVRAEALAGMAWAQAVAGDLGMVDGLLAEASAVTGTSDLLRHDIDVARAHALLRAGRFTDSYPPLVAGATAAGRAARPDLAYSCLINAASAAACAGDLPRALEFADRCLPLVVPNGLLRLCVYAHSARAALLRRLGRLGEAGAAIDQAAGAAERVGLPELEGLVHHDRGLLAAVAGDQPTASAELGLALDLGAPVSRPLARLLRADALARAGRGGDAEREVRAAALEPVSPADLPGTLVPRMCHVQGLVALDRGDRQLAARRLHEAAAGWERQASLAMLAGEGYVAALIDLGRPPVAALVEPDRELAVISDDLAAALAAGDLAEDMMPRFEDEARSAAPPEQVWKLLYDPGRFPEWWAGVETVERAGDSGGYTMYPAGYPDFPMPQRMRATSAGVTISCLVSDLVFEWRLAPLDGGTATSITVHVEIPEAEAHRLDTQRGVIRESLARLAALAAA